MKLIYLGHACFLVESLDGDVVFDPFQDDSVDGLDSFPKNISADLCLCSHRHDDHNASEKITIKPNAKSIKTEIFNTPHDKNNGAKRGMNKIQCVTLEGKRVVHLGDIGVVDATILKNIERCDVLLCPINGFFTIGAEEAKEVYEIVKPKLFIPMHYRDNNMGFGYPDDNQIGRFKVLFPNALKVKKSEVNLADLTPDTKILIFEDYKK